MTNRQKDLLIALVGFVIGEAIFIGLVYFLFSIYLLFQNAG
jgi:hypothetical protein